MANKYEKLVEEINKKEEIAEQKDNLAEQLSQVTKDVNTVKGIVDELKQAITDIKEVTPALTAASKSTDNAVTAIIQAILDSRKVVVTNKLDDETITQLRNKYFEYSKTEEGLFKKHREALGTMLDQNKDKCNDIINNADGVYFGRKTFTRLYIVFCVCFGIIVAEIVFGLLKLFGG